MLDYDTHMPLYNAAAGTSLTWGSGNVKAVPSTREDGVDFSPHFSQ